MKFIAEHIHAHIQEGLHKEYYVVFVPRRTMICERVLEELGVYADVQIREYHLELIPFDDDLLSLELDTSYKECFLELDRTSLYYVAKSIMKLQSMFGIIPTIRGIGTNAKLIKDMILRMRKELGADEPVIPPEIDSIILIDREADMVTPLLSQLTYEGLIDESYGIQNSYIDVDPTIVGQQKGGKKVKLALNSNDKLYSEIRDLHFRGIGPALGKKAKQIKEYQEKRNEASTISQLKDYARGLNAFQQEKFSLEVHIRLAEQIQQFVTAKDFHRRLAAEQNLLSGIDSTISTEYIEECINKHEPLVKILRLLCLLSLTNDGLKPKVHEFFKTELIQTYGYEYKFVIDSLEKLGLLKKQDGGRSVFPNLRKSLNLFVKDVDERSPNDIAYTYSVYAPLSIRLLQCALKPNWRELMKQLPYTCFEEHQTLPPGIQDQGKSVGARNSVSLVFFIGGVTFSEISAIRFINSQPEGGNNIITATTKLVNGDSLLQSTVMDIAEMYRPPATPEPIPTPTPTSTSAKR